MEQVPRRLLHFKQFKIRILEGKLGHHLDAVVGNPVEIVLAKTVLCRNIVCLLVAFLNYLVISVLHGSQLIFERKGELSEIVDDGRGVTSCRGWR